MLAEYAVVYACWHGYEYEYGYGYGLLLVLEVGFGFGFGFGLGFVPVHMPVLGFVVGYWVLGMLAQILV